MVDETLLISIDRTALSLTPLVCSGARDSHALGVSEYQEPAMQPRIQYAPTSRWDHGDVALSWAWQQTILGFSVFPTAASETEARSLHNELLAAVTQGLEFDVTVTVADAPPEVWRCNPGTVTYAGGRDVFDLRNHNPVWAVTLPCHPVRS